MFPEDIIVKILCHLSYFRELDDALMAFNAPKRVILKKKVYNMKLIKKETYLHENSTKYNYYRQVLSNKECFKVEKYYIDNLLHREDDLPAEIVGDGQMLRWCKRGKAHRDNGPAILYNNGKNAIMWCKDGEHHRNPDHSGPAFYRKIEDHNSIQVVIEWFVNGKLHRTNGHPAKIRQLQKNGITTTERFYYENGVKIKRGELFRNLDIIENTESS